MQRTLNIIDGEVFLPHGDRQLSHAITDRSLLWAVGDIVEEVFPFCGVVTDLVAEDAESTGGIAESTSDGLRREALDEEAAESFVVFVQGFLRMKEEARLRVCYGISGTDTHLPSMLFRFSFVKRAAAFSERPLFQPKIKVLHAISRRRSCRANELIRLTQLTISIQ